MEQVNKNDARTVIELIHNEHHSFIHPQKLLYTSPKQMSVYASGWMAGECELFFILCAFCNILLDNNIVFKSVFCCVVLCYYLRQEVL